MPDSKCWIKTPCGILFLTLGVDQDLVRLFSLVLGARAAVAPARWQLEAQLVGFSSKSLITGVSANRGAWGEI